jgi:hypothetical protein
MIAKDAAARWFLQIAERAVPEQWHIEQVIGRVT